MDRGNITNVSQIKSEWDLHDTCTYRGIKTTVGRVLFNNCLPSSYPFINEPVDKKKLNKILTDILSKYPPDVYAHTLDQLKRFGFNVYTQYPHSFPIDDLELPPEIEGLKKKLLDNVDDPAEFDKNLQELIKALQKALVDKNYDIYTILTSGSRGSWRQVAQVLIAKGIVIDPKGNVLKPITSSFAAGLKPVEHFHQGIGARSGIIDRALSTAPVGYLTRKMVMATQSVMLGKKTDCKTKRHIELYVDDELIDHLYGRYTVEGELITQSNAKQFIGKVIKLRTPIYCTSPKICRVCYGHLYDIIKTPYIGMIAAQTVGERGLQITMRTFHLGGVVSYVECNLFKELKENNLRLNVNRLAQYIKQDKSHVLSNTDKPMQLILDKSDYEIVGTLDIDKATGNVYCTRAFYATLKVEDETFDLALIKPVQIKIPISEETPSQYIFNISPGQEILELRQAVDSFSAGIDAINRIFDAKVPFKTVEQFLLTLWSKYKNIASDVDLVHFEVIISNLLRCRSNPSLPARLCPQWQPKQYPIKQIPFVDGYSWVLGLAFENASKAISTGLISPIKPGVDSLTPIEKITLGVS